MNHSPRPVFLNPMQLLMPVGAVTSILHRITGVFLAIGLPLSIYLLDCSLQSARQFAKVSALFVYWPTKVIALLMLSALAFHVLAGVRHLLSDFNVASTLQAARRSAWTVNLASITPALIAGGAML